MDPCVSIGTLTAESNVSPAGTWYMHVTAHSQMTSLRWHLGNKWNKNVNTWPRKWELTSGVLCLEISPVLPLGWFLKFSFTVEMSATHKKYQLNVEQSGKILISRISQCHLIWLKLQPYQKKLQYERKMYLHIIILWRPGESACTSNRGLMSMWGTKMDFFITFLI